MCLMLKKNYGRFVLGYRPVRVRVRVCAQLHMIHSNLVLYSNYCEIATESPIEDMHRLHI